MIENARRTDMHLRNRRDRHLEPRQARDAFSQARVIDTATGAAMLATTYATRAAGRLHNGGEAGHTDGDKAAVSSAGSLAGLRLLT